MEEKRIEKRALGGQKKGDDGWTAGCDDMVWMARPPVPAFHQCDQQTPGIVRTRQTTGSIVCYDWQTRPRNLAPGFGSTDEIGTSRSLSHNGSQKARTPQKSPGCSICHRSAFSDPNIGYLGFPTST
jgi:hypothetical protein